VTSGRTLLEAELAAWGLKRLEEVPKPILARALDDLNLRSADDLLAGLGEGGLSGPAVIRRLIPDAAKPKGAVVVKRPEPTGRVVVAGEQLPYTLAPCCRPLFPQPIIGYLTRGKGVTVHTRECRNLPAETERHAQCRWELQASPTEVMVTQVDLLAANRPGLLAAVTGAVARRGISIRNMVTKISDDEAQTHINFGVEVPDLFVLARLLHELKKVPGVLKVSRSG
jgi:GTP pyrophosphokinase